jgi:hypothetical protein
VATPSILSSQQNEATRRAATSAASAALAVSASSSAACIAASTAGSAGAASAAGLGAMGPELRSNRSMARTSRSPQAASSAASMALSSDISGTWCTTGAKAAEGADPTSWVGESAGTASAWVASSVASSRTRRSYSASGISGASSSWYSRLWWAISSRRRRMRSTGSPPSSRGAAAECESEDATQRIYSGPVTALGALADGMAAVPAGGPCRDRTSNARCPNRIQARAGAARRPGEPVLLTGRGGARSPSRAPASRRRSAIDREPSNNHQRRSGADAEA